MAADTPDPGAPDTKYSVSPRERAALEDSLVISDHAREQWAARMPDAARRPEWCCARSVRDEWIVAHPHFSVNSDPTHAVRVYRGRTREGEQYGAVFVVRDGHVPTCWRLNTVPAKVQEFGMPERVGLALRCYLSVIGEQGGVVDE